MSIAAKIRKNMALMACLMLLLSAGCDRKLNRKKIALASVNWAESVAMSNLSKVLLERAGYEVEIKTADVAPVFAAVAGGSADVFMDAWLPVTHRGYLAKYREKICIAGTNYKNARLGFVVPESSGIRSIAELAAKAGQFNGKVTGIDAGAGIMARAAIALKQYGLPMELQTSSEAAMLTMLKRKITAGQPVVVTGWSPHYMFSAYKLKFLDDPLQVFGRAEVLQTVANREFMAAHPELSRFFASFQLDDAELSSLLATFKAIAQEREAAAVWLRRHPAFAARMLASLQAPPQN